MKNPYTCKAIHPIQSIHTGRRWTVTLAFLLSAAPLWSQLRTESLNGHEAVAGEVLVKFKSVPAGRVNQVPAVTRAITAEDIDSSRNVGTGETFRMHSRSKDVRTLITELSANPDVEYAEPNFIVHALSAPNDPYFGSLWGLQNTGQAIETIPGKAGADTKAALAWRTSTGTRSNVVIKQHLFCKFS